MVDGDPRALKEKRATNIFEQNRDRFFKWRDHGQRHNTILFPDDVANVMIPKRILQLAEDPEKVKVLVLDRGSKDARYAESLEIMVVEEQDRNLTDPDKFREWAQTPPFLRHPFVEKRYEIPQFCPPGVHYQHYLYENAGNLLTNGIIHFDEMIWVNYIAKIPSGYRNTVINSNYIDKPDMWRSGIATSFFDNIEEMYRQLGFSFNIGFVKSNHPEFFAKRRVIYHDLSEAQRLQLPPNSESALIKVL